MTSLRAIAQATELAKVQKKARLQAISLGSLSEASRLFDADRLKGIIEELRDKGTATVFLLVNSEDSGNVDPFAASTFGNEFSQADVTKWIGGVERLLSLARCFSRWTGYTTSIRKSR